MKILRLDSEKQWRNDMAKGCRNEFPYFGASYPDDIVSMVIYTIWTLWRMENSQSEEMSLALFATLRNGLTVW